MNVIVSLQVHIQYFVTLFSYLNNGSLYFKTDKKVTYIFL